MILRDPQELVSRRQALTMTDVVATLVIFVAIVAILF
jgi:preprotein translocase subunit SecE